MSNKKNPPVDPDFDPTVPEDGAIVPAGESELRDIYSIHLPSREEIKEVAHDTFAGKLPEDDIQRLMHTSSDINESVRRIMHEHMTLGYRFGETLRLIQSSYVGAFGDSPTTVQRAFTDGLSYLEKLHRMSRSKIRVHLRAYARFHDNADAVEFLRLTDMQALLASDISDDIVEKVIEKKKNDPEMSTRAVKELVDIMRQQQDRINGDKERLEAANDEYASLLEQFNSANLESTRLRKELEQVRAQQTERQAAHDRLRNELALVGQSKNALLQQVHDMQQELDAVRQKMTDLETRPPVHDDPKVRDDVRQMNEHFNQLMAQSRELDEKIAERTEEVARIEAQLQENTAALEASRRLEVEMNELIRHFGEFVQRYHSAQLLCTAEGSPRRFAPLFEALGDLVAKFHTELVAARKAA